MNAEEFAKVLKKTFSPGKCREALVGSDYLSDVTLVLGSEMEELNAHTLFLMTASPILHQVFSDSTDNKCLNIKISDITKATMIEICRFAYSDNIRMDQNNMIDIMSAASKLQMKFLVEKAISFICKEGLNEHTVFAILEMNQKEKNMVINMKCFEFIQKNQEKCFKSNGFDTVSLDTLRLLLQAGGLSQTAGKQAVATWSAHSDERSDDIDELSELVSLLSVEEPQAPIATDRKNSDSESVHSKKSSATVGSINRGNQNQKQKTQQVRHPNAKINNARAYNNSHFSNPMNHPMNQQQQNGFNKPQQQRPQFPQQQCPQFPQQQRQPFPQQQRLPLAHNQKQPQKLDLKPDRIVPQILNNSFKNLTLQGSVSRKNFKVANLDLSTLSKMIEINEINFIYDLSTTDKQFELWIIDVTEDERLDLFYDKVFTKDKLDGKFQRYVLPRPCEIDAERKICIKVEFPQSEYRLSLNEDFSIAYSANKGGLALRSSEQKSSYAQIISNIAFSDC